MEPLVLLAFLFVAFYLSTRNYLSRNIAKIESFRAMAGLASMELANG